MLGRASDEDATGEVPEHRANILKAEFTVVGVAVSRDPSGSLYVTQDFLFPRRATR
ncbi:MAG: CAP domain-containing protein [Acidimicrobiia bacterium]